jgi:hypothetical protein
MLDKGQVTAVERESTEKEKEKEKVVEVNSMAVENRLGSAHRRSKHQTQVILPSKSCPDSEKLFNPPMTEAKRRGASE